MPAWICNAPTTTPQDACSTRWRTTSPATISCTGRTFDGLLERLQPMQLEPRRVLDLGCAVGDGSRALTKRFRRARVVSVDLSARMLHAARHGRPRFLSRRAEVQADAHRLPFPVGCFDLIVANQLLPWIENPDPVFAEIARTLRQEGLFLFSSLGPDSYAELRGAAPSPFPDMHDVGDGLVRSGLKDPVLDVEPLRINYSSGDKTRSGSARFGRAADHRHGQGRCPGRRRGEGHHAGTRVRSCLGRRAAQSARRVPARTRQQRPAPAIAENCNNLPPWLSLSH